MTPDELHKLHERLIKAVAYRLGVNFGGSIEECEHEARAIVALIVTIMNQEAMERAEMRLS
jgi:hypothetical protein